MERKCNIRRNRLNNVREDMKQQIKTVGAKITVRINQYQQNRTFVNNQGQFFQRLNNEEENRQCEIPNSEKAQTFWRCI